jgi:hypothetical protein
MLVSTGGVWSERDAMSPQASQPRISANSDVAGRREKRGNPQCMDGFGRMFRCWGFRIACTLLPLAMTAAHSETVDQMQAIINNPKTFCLRQDLHEYADVSYHECDKHDGLQGSQCVDEVTRRNNIIGKWNAMVRRCKISGNTTSGDPNLGKAKGSNTDSRPNDMGSRIEAAKKKAANAGEANRAALEKMKIDEQKDIVDRNAEVINAAKKNSAAKQTVEAERAACLNIRDSCLGDQCARLKGNAPWSTREVSVCENRCVANWQMCLAQANHDPGAIQKAQAAVNGARLLTDDFLNDLDKGVYNQQPRQQIWTICQKTADGSTRCCNSYTCQDF